MLTLQTQHPLIGVNLWGRDCFAVEFNLLGFYGRFSFVCVSLGLSRSLCTNASFIPFFCSNPAVFIYSVSPPPPPPPFYKTHFQNPAFIASLFFSKHAQTNPVFITPSPPPPFFISHSHKSSLHYPTILRKLLFPCAFYHTSHPIVPVEWCSCIDINQGYPVHPWRELICCPN